MAPELHETLRQEFASYTPAIDAYSFGMIMYEVLECAQPWSYEAFDFSYMIAEAILAGKRPALRAKADAPPAYVGLMQECWSQKPSLRPTFVDILRKLEDIRLGVYKSNLPRRPKRPNRAPRLLNKTSSRLSTLRKKIPMAFRKDHVGQHGNSNVGVVASKTSHTNENGVEMTLV